MGWLCRNRSWIRHEGWLSRGCVAVGGVHVGVGKWLNRRRASEMEILETLPDLPASDSPTLHDRTDGCDDIVLRRALHYRLAPDRISVKR